MLGGPPAPRLTGVPDPAGGPVTPQAHATTVGLPVHRKLNLAVARLDPPLRLAAAWCDVRYWWSPPSK